MLHIFTIFEKIELKFSRKLSIIINKMEENCIQDSVLESKVFKIPIEEYKGYIDAETVKEKKKEIIELFTI